MNSARSRGLKVLGIATYSPRWAQDTSVPPGTSHGRLASAALFGTFAGQAAAHFAGRIDTWEVCVNEPNLAQFLAPRVDAAFYTSMVAAGYSAIHAAVPRAGVLAGALAPGTDSADSSAASPMTFLQQMYAASVKNSLDAVSMHPYSYPVLPSGTQNWKPVLPGALSVRHHGSQRRRSEEDLAHRVWRADWHRRKRRQRRAAGRHHCRWSEPGAFVELRRPAVRLRDPRCPDR